MSQGKLGGILPGRVTALDFVIIVAGSYEGFQTGRVAACEGEKGGVCGPEEKP